MPAVYPLDIRGFSTKIDLEHTVFALHMNDVQDEITATQRVLGKNVHGSGTPSETNCVRTRLENLEVGKSAVSHDHANRLDITSHDIQARHQFGAALGTPGMPAPITVGTGGTPGSSNTPAREDHTHPVPSATSLAASLIPPGVIMAYGGTSAPAGWVFCDGASYLRGSSSSDPYYNLFQAIGTSYGIGSNSPTNGTFSVPDLRSKFPMGRATPAAAITTGGYADAQLPSHAHPNSSVSNGQAPHSHYVDHQHTTGDGGSHSHPVSSNGTTEPSGDRWDNVIPISVGLFNSNQQRAVQFNSGDGNLFAWAKIVAVGNHNHGWTGTMIGRTGTDGASGTNANHGHGLTIAGEGVSPTNRNLPPFQTVNWIIKL